jgi:hypothetical protein
MEELWLLSGKELLEEIFGWLLSMALAILAFPAYS